MADEKGNDNTFTNGDLNDDLTNEEMENCDENEYSAINDELDSLNSCLDELENWNDSLVSRMKEFLENMQKSRQQASSMNDTTNEISKEKIEIDK